MTETNNNSRIDSASAQMFEKFGVKPEKLGSFDLKKLDPTWIPEIIKEVINLVDIKPNTKRNQGVRTFILEFDTSELAKQFDVKFNQSVFKGINSYLTLNNLNPKKFERSLVISTEIGENSPIVTIAF